MLFFFEDYVLDAERREVRRGAALLSIEPQVFDLLLFLVRNRDQVVSKDDLLASVWGGRIVSESTLASRINAARRIIGDSGEQQRLIRTIIGKGIRFVAEVREVQKPAKISEGLGTRERRPPDKPSILVLPFANPSGEVDPSYFAAGIYEEIIIGLSRYPSLFVMACADKRRAADGTQMARELRVRYVLDGGVRKGDRIRVTARLVEAETGRHLWAERYDCDLVATFALEDEVAEAVTVAVASAIADAERQMAMRRPRDSLDAWSAYQCGLWHFGKFSRPDNALAQGYFRQAIEFDPAFSGGYKGLALSQVQEASVYKIRGLGEILRSAEALACQAVALAGRDSEAHAYLSTALWMRGDCESALAEAERALELSPNLALGHDALGSALILSGRPREGLVALEKAISLDAHEAMWPSRLHLLGLGLYFCGEYEATIEAVKRALRANPDYPLPYRWIAAALGQVGRIPEAKRALEKAIAIAPDLFNAYVRKRVPSLRPEDHAHMLDGLRKAGWKG